MPGPWMSCYASWVPTTRLSPPPRHGALPGRPAPTCTPPRARRSPWPARPTITTPARTIHNMARGPGVGLGDRLGGNGLGGCSSLRERERAEWVHNLRPP